MDAFKIAKKDLRALSKEKTIILAILLVLAISSLSKIVAMGLTILYSPSVQSNIHIGLVGKAEVFESVTPCVRYKNLDSAIKALKNNEIDVVLLINENAKGRSYVDAFIPENDIKAIKVIPALRKILIEYQDRLRAEKGIPVINIKAYDGRRYVDIPEGFSLQFEIIYLVLIPLMAILTAVISGIYIIDILSEEIERGTIDVLLCCIDAKDIVAGKVLSTLFLAAILTLFWIAGLIANKIEINAALTFLASFSIYIPVISAALLTVVRFKKRAEAQFVFSVIMIPLIFLLLSPLISIAKASLSEIDRAMLLYLFMAVVFLLASVIILNRSIEIKRG